MMHPRENFTECVRLDRPAHGGARHVRRRVAEPQSERIVVARDHILRRIVVQSEPVDGPADVLKVVGLEIRPHQSCDCGRINAPQLRIGKSEVPIGVERLSRNLIFRLFGRRPARLAIVNGAERRFLDVGAYSVDRGAMTEIHMMDGAQEHAAVDDARRLAAEAEAEQREHARLVEGRKAFHSIAVAARDHVGVVGEPLRAIAVRPAALVLQR